MEFGFGVRRVSHDTEAGNKIRRERTFQGQRFHGVQEGREEEVTHGFPPWEEQDRHKAEALSAVVLSRSLAMEGNAMKGEPGG